MHSGHRQLYGLRRDLAQVLLEQLGDRVGVLVGNETHADLGHRHGGNDRLGTFPGET